MSELGLKRHIKNNRTLPCGFWARRTKRDLKIAEQKRRSDAIQNTKLKDLGPPKKLGKSTSRPRGKPLSKDEKNSIIRMHDIHFEDMKDSPRPAVSRFKDLSLFFQIIGHFVSTQC